MEENLNVCGAEHQENGNGVACSCCHASPSWIEIREKSLQLAIEAVKVKNGRCIGNGNDVYEEAEKVFKYLVYGSGCDSSQCKANKNK